MSKEAMKLALKALCKMIPCDDVCDCTGQRAITALREALAEQPAQQGWKLVPREATPEMLKAMDECSKEGYDERLYAGHASSVYMAAWDASPAQPQQEPVTLGYMNAGHVHEMQQGRLPYGYVYPKRGAGASAAVYASPPAQRKPLTITEESAWGLARYVYARSNPHESPQILLSAMEIKQIIEAAHGIKEQP